MGNKELNILELLGFRHDSFSEMVLTTRDIDESILVFPIGILVDRNGLLKARVFPGTTLSKYLDKVYEACLSQPRTPDPFIYGVTKDPAFYPVFEPPKVIHSPCISNSLVRIETIIVKHRTGTLGTNLIYLEPISISVSIPSTYKRYYGCFVELLIAFTKIRYFYLIRDCKQVVRYINIAVSSYNCILHSTSNSLYHSIAFKITREAYRYASIAGCITEENLRTLM